MKYLLSAILLGAMALNAPITFAEDKPATEDHQIHHPDDQKKEVKPVVNAINPDVMQKADMQMAAMMSMHSKMMNAKTPEERHALMTEHMKIMQSGMAMMNNMSNDAKGMMSGMMMGNQGKDGNAMMSGMQGGMMQHHQMMDKRMDMMQMMMQMMMDRLPAEPKK